MLQGKVLVAQGGGPTAVINQSLVGAVLEARKFRDVSLVYGALHGVRGIVDEELVDLTQETTHNLELVGETPISHLTAYRMFLASGELADGKRKLIEVAESIGYTSEKAFSRAFRRWSGVPPRRYTRDAQILFDQALSHG